VLLQQQVEQLSILREVGVAISSTLELSEALPIIANVVQGALDIRRLTIYELSEDGGYLLPMVAKYGDDLITRDRLVEESLSRRSSPWTEVLDRRIVVLHADDDHSAAYVPLVTQTEVLGAMVLEDRRDGLPFESEDIVLLQQLGAQISIAIHNAKLYALAVTDGLTGLYVRRYFDLRLAEEFSAAERYRRQFSLMLFDIDHFKKFNDTYGHQTGDLVLQQFARLLQDTTRATDICCRYGGEEMAIILPETEGPEATRLAEKLCLRVRENPFRDIAGNPLHVTTSVGVAFYSEIFTSPERMVAATDEALYEAKEAGRDQVRIAEEPA